MKSRRPVEAAWLGRVEGCGRRTLGRSSVDIRNGDYLAVLKGKQELLDQRVARCFSPQRR